MKTPMAHVQLTGPVNALGHEDPQGAYYMVTLIPHGGERSYFRMTKGDAEDLRDRANSLVGSRSITELLREQREADAEWLKGKFAVGSIFHEELPRQLRARR